LKKLQHRQFNQKLKILKKYVTKNVLKRSTKGYSLYFKKLINFLKKKGFSIKSTNLIITALSSIYTYLLGGSIFENFFKKNYLNIMEFKFILNSNLKLNNVLVVLYWLVNLKKTQLEIKLQKVSKK